MLHYVWTICIKRRETVENQTSTIKQGYRMERFWAVETSEIHSLITTNYSTV